MGGVQPWNGEHRGTWRTQAIDDGLLEVVSLRGTLHLGQLQVGLGKGAHRLAQGTSILLRTSVDLPMQTDGEPWSQPACEVTIKRQDQVRVLHRASQPGIQQERQLMHMRSQSATELPLFYDPFAD